MPVIKSAIKKLRKDRKRTQENDSRKRKLEKVIRQARKSSSTPIKSGSKISAAFSLIDRAVKRNIIHKNKAARLKASLSRLAGPSRTNSEQRKPSGKAKRTASVRRSAPKARNTKESPQKK